MMQAADLVIGPDHLGFNNQSNIALGKVVLHLRDYGNRRVIGITDATHDLKDWVIKLTKAGQAVVETGRGAFERLENGDRRKGRESRGNRPITPAGTEKTPGRIHIEKSNREGQYTRDRIRTRRR